MKNVMNVGGFALVLACNASVFAGDCQPHWDNTIGAVGMPGAGPTVDAVAVFDDASGDGPAVYAAGEFSNAGGVAVNHIAKWDGSSWSALGSGVGGVGSQRVRALAVFDDGSGAGPALYAGGQFALAGGVAVSNIAKWDGSSWSPLDSGVSGLGANVYAMTVFDDGSGSGPALYAGGTFTTAGGEPANFIARWDGSSWSPLGSGMNHHVSALVVFDDGSGSGPALHAGGFFTTAGGQRANYIAKWDGSSWSAVGNGVDEGVAALAVFDDGAGSGPALYAGGFFDAAGKQPAHKIAKWDGSTWSPLGLGIGGGGVSWVTSLAVFNDGAGEALYIGGFFTTAGGEPANRIARWDGSSWSALGSGVNGGVISMNVLDDGAESGTLYVGGQFTTAGGETANRIAAWQGCAIQPQCAFADLNCDGVVNVLDLLILVHSFGPCPPPSEGDCPADLNGDGVVDALDLRILLGEMTPGNPGGPNNPGNPGGPHGPGGPGNPGGPN